MAEELVLTIKSNTKTVTKDTQEYAKTLEQAEGNVKELNNSLNAQNNFIIDLEKELQKLKNIQDSIPKGAWHAGQEKLNEDIRNVTAQVKDSKLELKGLKQEQKEAKETVKEFNKAQKEQGDTLLSNIGNYKVFGISLNGIKKAFGKIIPTAKLMFKTIKTGLMSTGVGALVVAFGSLVAWFSQTKKGAETLSKIFTGLGAAIQVIVDRIAKFGSSISKAFSGDLSGAWKDMKGALTGVGDEMTREIALAMALKASLQALADKERNLNVETAKRRAEIENLKLAADDLNLTEEERLSKMEQAGAIETKLMADRVANAEEAVRIQQTQMSMSDNMKDDLDALAQKEIALANIRRESSKMQRTIQTKLNRIKKQAAAQEVAAQKKWVQRQNEKIKKQNQTVITFNKMRREELLKTLKNERNRENTQALWKMQEREKLINDTVFDEAKKEKLLNENFTFHSMEKQRIKKKYDDISKENEKTMAADLLSIQNETLLLQIENVRDRADKEMEIAKEAELKGVEGRTDTAELQAAIEDKYAELRKEKKDKEAEEDKQRDKDVAAAKVAILQQGLETVQSLMDLQSAQIEQDYKKEIKLAEKNGKSTEKIEEKFEKKRQEQAKKMKAMKIAMAIVDTYQSAVSAYAAGMSVGGPAGLVLGPVSAGLAVIAGLANVAMIEKQPLGDGGGGGGGGGGGAAPSGANPPAPQMMSGQFSLESTTEPEPLQAFVLTDEMTNSQNQLANIRRRSTI
tara:strand:- start:106 stop:2334 length:2229 start_codon:yes stop_codon:yes gene_type:complete